MNYSFSAESNKKDPFRAQVQWYSRIGQLSKKLRKVEVNPPLDESWELVHEGQRYKGDLSIETIFGKCTVWFCGVDHKVSKTKIGKKNKSWEFFCRFGLGPKNSCYFIPVDESTMKHEADVITKSLTEKSAAKINNNEITTPSRKSSRSRRTSGNEENEHYDQDLLTTPRSTRRGRPPTRYLEETLPSPLKNAKFSVSATKTRELCIVIQRCNVSPKKDTEGAQADEVVKVKARKRLDLEETPSKVSRYIFSS